MTKEKEKIFEIINTLDRIRLQQEFYKKLWPKAEWVNGCCSLCGEKAITEWYEKGAALFYSNFCPNCGAKMEGEQHEIDRR